MGHRCFDRTIMGPPMDFPPALPAQERCWRCPSERHNVPRFPQAKKATPAGRAPPSLGRKRPSKQQQVKPPRCCNAQTSPAERACKGKMAQARRFVLAAAHTRREWSRIGASVPRPHPFRRFLTRAREVRWALGAGPRSGPPRASSSVHARRPGAPRPFPASGLRARGRAALLNAHRLVPRAERRVAMRRGWATQQRLPGAARGDRVRLGQPPCWTWPR